MRISDWSSDVCSSDLRHDLRQAELPETEIDGGAGRLDGVALPPGGPRQPPGDLDAGSARDRIGRLVETDEADERRAAPALNGEESPAALGHPHDDPVGDRVALLPGQRLRAGTGRASRRERE